MRVRLGLIQNNLVIIMVFVLLVTVVSCAKREDPSRIEDIKDAETENSTHTGEYAVKRKQIQKDDIGIIDEFTPEIFVKLTILYRRESEIWLKEAQSIEPKQRDKFLERENEKFFTRFGTTEEEYIQYSENNIEKLNEYMSEHPELLSELQNYD